MRERYEEALRTSIPDILSVGIPSLMVLVGILLNQSAVSTSVGDMRDLRTELGSLRGDRNTGFQEVRGEMMAMRQQSHDDLLMLMASDNRLARLAGRINS